MDLREFWDYTRWHHAANERRYDAPADPSQLVRVPPEFVESYTSEIALNRGLGQVRGGDWDREQHRESIRETAIYRGLRQRFEDGADWEETALYEQIVDRFAEQDQVRGYESIEAYRAVRCAYLDELYESIRDEGYRANEAASHERASNDNEFEDAYANHLEPLVVIGRDGDVVWTEGYHRFSIADILDVEAIPVYVLCRHEQWQRTRDRVANTSDEGATAVDAPLNHPDLRDVRS